MELDECEVEEFDRSNAVRGIPEAFGAVYGHIQIAISYWNPVLTRFL